MDSSKNEEKRSVEYGCGLAAIIVVVAMIGTMVGVLFWQAEDISDIITPVIGVVLFIGILLLPKIVKGLFAVKKKRRERRVEKKKEKEFTVKEEQPTLFPMEEPVYENEKLSQREPNRQPKCHKRGESLYWRVVVTGVAVGVIAVAYLMALNGRYVKYSGSTYFDKWERKLIYIERYEVVE